MTAQRNNDSLQLRKLACGSLFVSLIALSNPALANTQQSTQPDVDPQLRTALIKAIKKSDSFAHKYDAEVWLTDMSSRLTRWVPDAKQRLKILRTVHSEAVRSQLEPELVLAVIHVESRFDRWALSYAGAQGLMQVMPFWLDEIGRPNDNLFHIDTNLRMGCTILRYYLDMEKGNLFRALGRYNGSLGKAKYPNKVITALKDIWYPM